MTQTQQTPAGRHSRKGWYAAGALLGGLVIDHGRGLGAIPLVAALAPLISFGVAVLGIRLERNAALAAPATACL